MNQEAEKEELMRQIDRYEQSLKDCSMKELRDLRYKLKQVKEKLRSLNQGGKK
jgi:hypothetical protein